MCVICRDYWMLTINGKEAKAAILDKPFTDHTYDVLEMLKEDEESPDYKSRIQKLKEGI